MRAERGRRPGSKGADGMATYVVLYKFTDEGAKHARDTVKRAR